MPGSFLVLNIWAGSLFSMSASDVFQMYFKRKSNNMRASWELNIFPGLPALAVLLFKTAAKSSRLQERPGERQGLPESHPTPSLP